jgi:hypothetical protein
VSLDPEAEVRARSGRADVLLRYPRFDRVDTFEARVLTQAFLVTAGSEAASLEERRKLFLNGVVWLLRVGECQNFAATPSCEEEERSVSAGSPVTLSLRVASNGRCPVSGVVVTNLVPAGFAVESAGFRAQPEGGAQGTTTVRDGAVVYRFGLIEPGTDVVLETRVVPRWGGTFTNVFRVSANYRRPETCTEVIRVTGPECAAPALTVAVHGDRLQLEMRDPVGCDVVLEESGDLLQWQWVLSLPAGTPAGELGVVDMAPSGQRFYRLRRAP